MGYRVLDPEDIELMPNRPSKTRSVSDATGLENMGIRLYEVAPGEDIPYSGLHYHDEQEEVFYVINGEIQVETPDELYEVPEGNLFVAEPESPHRAFNGSTDNTDATVLAVGAPSVRDGHRYEE